MNIPSLRTMAFTEMMDEFGKMIEDARFEAGPDEHEVLLQERLRRTLDKAPPLYAFFLEATSYLSYWTDMAANLSSQTSDKYKDMRNKRDAAERLSKAVKLYYESASRRITLLQDQQDYQHRR